MEHIEKEYRAIIDKLRKYHMTDNRIYVGKEIYLTIRASMDIKGINWQGNYQSILMNDIYLYGKNIILDTNMDNISILNESEYNKWLKIFNRDKIINQILD